MTKESKETLVVAVASFCGGALITFILYVIFG